MKLMGIIPPLVTPMHADESLDLDGLKSHIDWLLVNGVHGIFVLGTTGEFYALDESEKQAVDGHGCDARERPRAGLRRHRGRIDPRSARPHRDG